MKYNLLLAAALIAGLSFASTVRAEAPVSPTSPTTATTPVAAAPSAPSPAQSAQTSKMKSCAAQYHQQNIPKDQYRIFMSGCLKKDSTASATPATPAAPAAAAATPPAVTKASVSNPVQTQQDKMKGCNADAKTQNLTGDARKSFMKTCLTK